MNNRLLFCWLGATDLRAASGQADIGLGPVGQAARSRDYQEIILLNNWNRSEAENYVNWLQGLTSSPISLIHVELSGPTKFGEIYQAASKAVSAKIGEGAEAQLVFHLSPGTPAMAAVWILLAKARFSAELIESSKDHGVRAASVPFDIAADFLPDLFRKPDKHLERLASGLPETAPEFDDIIHRSEVMQRIILKARRVAPRSIPVLIEGESGTGKELFARAIHDAGPRKHKPFVAINCGAIPSELVESELFGHEKGAFTGAVTARVGHFEAAHTGTIFLDEIGELPKEMQVKLLRTLQEGEVRRIGAAQPRNVDVRIIAATNRNLIDEVAAGSFREDLFFRLAVAVINLPPLREREGDLSLLIDRFLERINRESESEPGYKHKKISASARNLLLRHPWPGNIRELQNTLTRAAVWSMDEELVEQDIREALLPVPAKGRMTGEETILNRPFTLGFSLPEVMKTVAVHYLERGLAEHDGNKTIAAKTLGLPSYQTLTNWLKKYGLE
ncbi:sigma-54 interaction domain-containing protein [Desulfobulbus oligotrophicus]|uniref:Sigma 54-interacting transcriptional regulator n=1 Tax=Desulfobulbus oligotrophicus TaxID=1909699 RepID=A0A7T5VFF2_9BACT|nr:sigma 54-interacting transcriptional regulator [Desulfobulbus oligotrophicus]QQG66912.1 sigma 54-interacting transcriptional regulator [Desulfobulbus oligotrophicus]